MTLYTCCRHCVPHHPAHPTEPDAHTTPCGPAWCTEGSRVAPQAVQLTLEAS